MKTTIDQFVVLFLNVLVMIPEQQQQYCFASIGRYGGRSDYTQETPIYTTTTTTTTTTDPSPPTVTNQQRQQQRRRERRVFSKDTEYNYEIFFSKAVVRNTDQIQRVRWTYKIGKWVWGTTQWFVVEIVLLYSILYETIYSTMKMVLFFTFHTVHPIVESCWTWMVFTFVHFSRHVILLLIMKPISDFLNDVVRMIHDWFIKQQQIYHQSMQAVIMNVWDKIYLYGRFQNAITYLSDFICRVVTDFLVVVVARMINDVLIKIIYPIQAVIIKVWDSIYGPFEDATTFLWDFIGCVIADFLSSLLSITTSTRCFLWKVVVETTTTTTTTICNFCEILYVSICQPLWDWLYHTIDIISSTLWSTLTYGWNVVEIVFCHLWDTWYGSVWQPLGHTILHTMEVLVSYWEESIWLPMAPTVVTALLDLETFLQCHWKQLQHVLVVLGNHVGRTISSVIAYVLDDILLYPWFFDATMEQDQFQLSVSPVGAVMGQQNNQNTQTGMHYLPVLMYPGTKFTITVWNMNVYPTECVIAVNDVVVGRVQVHAEASMSMKRPVWVLSSEEEEDFVFVCSNTRINRNNHYCNNFVSDDQDMFVGGLISAQCWSKVGTEPLYIPNKSPHRLQGTDDSAGSRRRTDQNSSYAATIDSFVPVSSVIDDVVDDTGGGWVEMNIWLFPVTDNCLTDSHTAIVNGGLFFGIVLMSVLEVCCLMPMGCILSCCWKQVFQVKNIILLFLGMYLFSFTIMYIVTRFPFTVESTQYCIQQY